MVDVDYIEGCAIQRETVLRCSARDSKFVRGQDGSLYSRIADWAWRYIQFHPVSLGAGERLDGILSRSTSTSSSTTFSRSRLSTRSLPYWRVTCLPEVRVHGLHKKREGPGSPSGGRGGMAMAMVAWLHATSDVFPFFCPCAVSRPWSWATTVGEWRRRHSLRRHKAGTWTAVSVRSRVSFNGCGPRLGGPRYVAGSHWLHVGVCGEDGQESKRGAAPERTPLSLCSTSPRRGWLRRGKIGPLSRRTEPETKTGETPRT